MPASHEGVDHLRQRNPVRVAEEGGGARRLGVPLGGAAEDEHVGRAERRDDGAARRRGQALLARSGVRPRGDQGEC